MRTKTNEVIDVSLLPKSARKELFDFYSFLLTKYTEKKGLKQENKKTLFMKQVETQRYHLPDDFDFNRDIANER